MGYVKDIPGGDVFYAIKGRGAYCGGKKLKTEHDAGLDYLGFHVGEEGKGLEGILDVIRNSRHIRSYGSIAMSLCYVASGALDAYVDFRPPRLIDIAAGKLIVEEDHHVFGIFSQKTWIDLCSKTGFRAELVEIKHSETEPGMYNAILGIKTKECHDTP